jgi:hypothetical protein
LDQHRSKSVLAAAGCARTSSCRLRARPATDRSTHSLRLLKLRLKVLTVHEFNAHHRARLALVK